MGLIVEEPSDIRGRWFAMYGADGVEHFSARLLHGTDELEVAWAASVRQIAPRVAEIQSVVGCTIRQVRGTASAGIEATIKAGRFHPDPFARQLCRHLKGKWTVKTTRRSGVASEVWDIIAVRTGGLP